MEMRSKIVDEISTQFGFGNDALDRNAWLANTRLSNGITPDGSAGGGGITHHVDLTSTGHTAAVKRVAPPCERSEPVIPRLSQPTRFV
jgi:hypothetical protein